METVVGPPWFRSCIRTALAPVPEFDLERRLCDQREQRRSILEHFCSTLRKGHDELSPAYGMA